MKPVDKAPGRGRSGRGGGARASRCPMCGKPAVEAYRPFCSRLCADEDLGRWLGGHYAIPGPPAGEQDAGTNED